MIKISNNNSPKWESNLTFVLAMIGSAVGLGNIWRYPYVAYTNGAGAFLLPYIISIICFGIPLLFMEYGTGYKFKVGMSNIVRKINTKYEYVGWFIQTSTFFILSYYVCVVAWDLLYIPLSFFKGWGSNPDNFFTNVILESSADVSGLFHIALFVLVSLLVVWFIIWFISHRDLNSGVGFFNKIITPALFVIMIIIVGFAVTLPGASTGILTLLTPHLSSLTDGNIWIAALSQILFSLSIGMCIVVSYTAYLPDDVNIPKNILVVAFANSSFEVFTAIGIFGILGFMSTTSGIPINELVTQGTGLAFVAFPQIFNVMGLLGYIIGPLFFIALLFAGLTSNVSIAEPLILSLRDKFNFSRKKATTLVCFVGLIVSLVFTTSLGATLLGIVDTFINQFGIVLNVIIELILIAWIYGLEKLIPGINKNATFLSAGGKLTILIKYILPVVVFIIWIKGLSESVINGDSLTMAVQTICLAGLIIIPLILTKLPAKNDDY